MGKRKRSSTDPRCTLKLATSQSPQYSELMGLLPRATSLTAASVLGSALFAGIFSAACESNSGSADPGTDEPDGVSTAGGGVGGEAGSDTGGSNSGDGDGDAVTDYEPIGKISVWQPSMDRALVALPHDDGVFLSWRLFADDDVTTAFHVYRVKDGKRERLTDLPLDRRTNFVAKEANLQDEFIVTVLVHGIEVEESDPAWNSESDSSPFLTLNQENLTAHSRAPAVGDLNGSSRLDYVFRYSTVTVDPAKSNWYPVDEQYRLRAYDHAGSFLWEYPMGWSIETGIWYAPYLIYDLDQDGKAELIVKAGDDSLSKDELRDETGRVMFGPEYLRIVDGTDGATILAEADWPDRSGFRGADPPETPIEDREYAAYNRWSRNLLTIAFLDGKTPHVIVERGTYGILKVAAYKYDAGALERVWYFESEDPYAIPKIEPGEAGFAEYDAAYRERHRWWGQGAHSLRAGDIDGDGKDEVIVGSMALDHDGSRLWSMNRGDVDHVYLGDLVPERAGLELYFGTERHHDRAGMGMADAATGEFLWTNDWPTTHIHAQGMCGDLYATHAGTECYSGEAALDGFWVFDNMGNVLSDESLYGSLSPHSALWDADPQRELLAPSDSATDFLLYQPTDAETGDTHPFLKIPTDVDPGEQEYVRLLAVMDIVGDYREELLVSDRGRMLFYSSNIEAADRRVWLMQDPIYRQAVNVNSMGYLQDPQLSYDLASTPAP